MSLSDNKNTLKGYDIVLSISAEAINAQFQTLYDKELPPDLLPPPAHLAGEAAPLPRPKHYINHDFQVFPQPEVAEDDEEEEEEEPEEIEDKDRQGINAHIGAPRIAFHPEKQGVAIITLKFRRDETVEDEERKDSVLQYWIFTKSGRRRTKVLNLNGWEFSWHADIGQKDIDDVVSDLINPAENSDSQIQLPDTVITQLKDKLNTDGRSDGVNSSTFTASSIFCVIEAVQMTESFIIKPPAGVPEPTGDEQTRLITSITRHFKGLKDVAESGKDESHLPTPHNPFVLGYGIRQKVPELSSINGNADPTKTPPYFLPASVDSTTTASPGNGFTEGTLNFCMLTNRRSGGSRSMPREDRNAGEFPETFFNKLRLYGGAGNSERPGGHDGVMAFSKEVFNDFWLNEYVVNRLISKPEEYGYTLRMHGSIESVGMSRYNKRTDLHDARHQLDYEYNEIPCPREPVYEQKRTAYGSNTVDARYSSDFLNYNEDQRKQTDLQRNLHIDIDVYNELKLTHWTMGINSFFSGGLDFWNSVDRWMEGRTAEMRSK
ncbi:hypothetical protein ACJZ2D_003741 [Fusarium nematophilum]